MNFCQITCADDGCAASEVFRESALALGWLEAGGKLYCPGHGAIQEHRTRMEAESERLAVRANKIWAKEYLSAGDYLAWDEFQSDLVNFHRETGRLAHRELRILSPHAFIRRHRVTGRIDIRLSDESMQAAEKAYETHRIERLR